MHQHRHLPLLLLLLHLRQLPSRWGIDSPHRTCFPAPMAWTKPEFSRSQVDQAGAVLIAEPTDYIKLFDAQAVINNWRSSHAFPLNTFQAGLRPRSKQVDSNSLVAQRIKRLSSIDAKLRRFPNMKLSQMQDIGGCRAVVSSSAKVYDLVTLFHKSWMKHKHIESYDYIKCPKKSGYRGIHLIYKYYSDKTEAYNGLRIEVQLRSVLQHSWATAVETAGMFTREALKSSQGSEDWLRFFALMGTSIALTEHSEPVPNTPTNELTLKEELKKYAKQLDVVNHLRVYGFALKTIQEKEGARNAHYFLLMLEPANNRLTITSYQRNQLSNATDHYLKVEREIKGTGSDAVLVSVDSISALKRAYPNYFADTHVFMRLVDKAVM